MPRTGVSTIGIVGLALGLCAVAGRAADIPTDWDQLQKLHPGDQVRVELRGKPDVVAEFGAVTADGLHVVRGGKAQVDLERTEILWVYRVLKRSEARAAAPWIGGIAGFGAGFAAAWAGGSQAGPCLVACISRPAAGVALGSVGAALGALAGHLAPGRARTTEAPVYRADWIGPEIVPVSEILAGRGR